MPQTLFRRLIAVVVILPLLGVNEVLASGCGGVCCTPEMAASMDAGAMRGCCTPGTAGPCYLKQESAPQVLVHALSASPKVDPNAVSSSHCAVALLHLPAPTAHLRTHLEAPDPRAAAPPPPLYLTNLSLLC